MRAKVLRGWAEISEFMRVNPTTLKHWNEDYGLPIIKVGKEDKGNPVYAIDQDLVRWLRIWRVRDYLEREGSIRVPPEIKQVKQRLAKAQRRMAYHRQKKETTDQ